AHAIGHGESAVHPPKGGGRPGAALRGLLAKATAAFGDDRLDDLRSEESVRGGAARCREGHRFEATQALRQVLNAAVAWQLIDVNPARRGAANPLRRFPEKRPFESWDDAGASLKPSDGLEPSTPSLPSSDEARPAGKRGK